LSGGTNLKRAGGSLGKKSKEKGGLIIITRNTEAESSRKKKKRGDDGRWEEKILLFAQKRAKDMNTPKKRTNLKWFRKRDV